MCLTVKPTIIVDIDGTVALSKRDPAEAEAAGVNCRPWFEATAEQILNDTPHKPIVALVRMLCTYYIVAFITGREERSRGATVAWLMRYDLWGDSSVLMMRRNDDDRPDEVVKLEQYMKYRGYLSPACAVHYVIEDRTCCANMWRKAGLLCLDVAGNE